MGFVFVAATLAVLPLWLLLLLFVPDRVVTARVVHAVWAFAALAVLYAAVLTQVADASPTSLLTWDGYRELYSDDAVLLAGWLHYLALDLFAGAWIVRDASRTGVERWVTAVCVWMTFALAPLGLAIYLVVPARRTGTTHLPAEAPLL